MSDAPVTHIDPAAFAADPYPALARMRAQAPVTYVPELGATLFTRRDDIFEQEKRIDVFSSHQPNGLLEQIMGANMMRKDGNAHQIERKALFPAVSPRTVRDVWADKFDAITMHYIEKLKPLGRADIVRDFALPIAADSLREMTGLTNMPTLRMDYCSQAMLDGCANYTRDREVEKKAYDASFSIDDLIDARISDLDARPDTSIISVLHRAGLSRDAIAGTVKVIIGGGQNEPRDAIAGTAWALLSHPEQHALIRDGHAGYADAFGEYIRWVTPIGMTPRRIARPAQVCDVNFEAEETIFFMFSSGCRDEAYFENGDAFDITRDTSAAIAFGAGPHFCAGAAASRCMIADFALPRLFRELPGLELDGSVACHGWAFRGPLCVPVRWKT
ncbi:MAG: cytochrome P450 [Pseudomonadota bacterium]